MKPGHWCINRNILECKVIRSGTSANVFLRINRNILECKVLHRSIEFGSFTVLIETYWNVKKQFAEMSENRVEY